MPDLPTRNISSDTLQSADQSSTNATHIAVSEAYTAAIERAASNGDDCCSAQPAGVAACSAGYGDELAGAPTSAAQSSFGCGNPLATEGITGGQTVLDLGSGAGLDLVLAARRVGPSGRVIGVDMTEAMLAAARRHLEQAEVSWAEVRRGLIEDLPVESASVDWVISNCVINLSPDKAAVFSEISRVLKPGGNFSISDIVASDLPEEILSHQAAHAACIAGAVSEAKYLQGLEAAGLEDVRVVERLIYTEDQLRALVGSDLKDVGVEAPDLEQSAALAAGNVASVRVVGRRPG